MPNRLRSTPEKGRPKPVSAYRTMVAVALRILDKRAKAPDHRDVVSMDAGSPGGGHRQGKPVA